MKELTTLSVIDNQAIPERPEDFDLRFFRRVCYSDAYDGKSAVMGGFHRSLILYGYRIVWERNKFYDHSGAGCGAREVGNRIFWDMYLVSELYLRILRIGRAKFFEGHRSDQDEELRISSEDWDCLSGPDPKILQILTTHPQYLGLVADFGLTLDKLRREIGHCEYLQVNVSKRYEQQTTETGVVLV